MLKLKEIKKKYETGGEAVEALKGIDLEFRKSEFVSILGPSGCGKTTLLNIIGGLDHYSSGDLVIKDKSTKKYKDHDWDSYRNHSVGFVFQGYNLIPHQTVLANVELALTLSGVSKKERRRRAEDALRRVGLADQMNKKPTQMSGGQMQRVAIARAIVNDPEILLADEPTGALDTETSVQVMEILKEIACDRLVIMVTHNPELAEKYSTRIIKLIDGKVIGDSNPYDGSAENGKEEYKAKKTHSMSLFTALGLSVNNLLTKKGRTIMTCFAGSIGIIGIALILSVSNGVNIFIDKIQGDTLSKYPLTIESEPVDMTLLLSAMSGENGDSQSSSGGARLPRESGKIYAANGMSKMVSAMTSIPTSKNNIVDFKKYIESNSDFEKYTSAISYSYNIPMNFYTKDCNDNIVKADSQEIIEQMYASMGVNIGAGSVTGSMLDSYSSAINVWEELLGGEKGELINPMLKEQHDIVAGKWPENKNEVILIVNSRNEVSDFVLYALGMKSSSELGELMKTVMEGKEIEFKEQSWTYDEIIGKQFRLVTAADTYKKQEDGTYIDLSADKLGLDILYSDPSRYTEITICGIVKPNENAMFNMVSGALGYTSQLTEYIIERTSENELIKEQLANEKTDVLTGLPFASQAEEEKDEEKIQAVKDYIKSLDTAQKAQLYISVSCVPTDEYVKSIVEMQMNGIDREKIVEQMVDQYSGQQSIDINTIKSYIEMMSDDELFAKYREAVSGMVIAQYSETVSGQLSSVPVSQLAEMLDNADYGDETYVMIYDKIMPSSVSESTYEKNLEMLGNVDKDDPKQIIIYASTFDDKNKVSELVDEYNSNTSEENRIKVTDYVALLMSSVSTVINAVTYVLIAFVGISLVVSSIMIGVITNISVLERTKEIGILRAIGASKADIRHVFNAETFIIGTFAGIIGIGVTLLLIIPINIILHHFTDIAYLNASLPVSGAVILIILSMILTLIAGFIPARSASGKDPVVALRSE